MSSTKSHYKNFNELCTTFSSCSSGNYYYHLFPLSITEESISLLIKLEYYLLFRFKMSSSHQGCSKKNGILRNFANFTGKHLCQALFFNKVAGLRPATLFKNRLWHKCFPVNFSAHSSSQKENFFITSKNLLKNRNLAFPIVRYFT